MAVVKEGGQTQDQNMNPVVNPAPRGMALKLTDMFAKGAAQGAWSGDALEYLQAIRNVLEDSSMPVKMEMSHVSSDAVAFSTKDKFSVILVRDSEIVNLGAMSADAKFYAARDAFYELFPDNKLVNIVSCNKFMFSRPSQMASYINKTLTAQSDDSIRDFNIGSFGDRYQIVIDSDMSNVRSFYDVHSPNPTVCGEFGFIASIQDKADTRFNTFQQTTPMFAATGYVEFVRNESNNTFIPMVHITDILSVLTSSKILALALPLIGEIFIGHGLWRQPFSNLGTVGCNIGNLIVDHATQKPYEVKSDADFRKMFREYIGTPILCIDIAAGQATIPGLSKITRPSDNVQLMTEIYDFLNIGRENVAGAIGENIFKEIVGVWETSKSVKFSNAMDTRAITYLYAVSKLKWSPRLEALLDRTEADPVRRFDMIRELVGEVTPTYSSITTLLYGDFIRKIAGVVAQNVKVVMPAMANMPTIDLTGYVDKSYQPGINMFGNTSASNLIGGGWLRSF